MKKFIFICIALAGFIASSYAQSGAIKEEPLNYTLDDYRNFYGICWRGSAQDNIDYARQMGYTHMLYQDGMEWRKNLDGLKFYLESPEYMTYQRIIDITKKYTPEEIKEIETICALKDASKPFPQNIATGWFAPPNKFTAVLDFQQKRVINITIDKIFQRVKQIEKRAPNFKFAGIAWDVPKVEGDFWTERKGAPMNNGKPVNIGYWTGSDSASKHPDVVHDFPTHKLGHFEFFRILFERTRKEMNPNAKFIVEPFFIYKDWLSYVDELIKEKGLEETKKYIADFVCEEGPGTDFAIDPRNTASGLYKKNQFSSTTPDVFDEPSVRKITALAAINGAWTHWFGRPGATGNMPDYKSIRDVPARLKLARAIAVWENLNNTPLSKRKWDGKTYSSPTAFMDKDGLGALQPERKKFFFVFNTKEAKIPIPEGYEIESIFFTDSLFREFTNNEMNSFKPSMHVRFFRVKDAFVLPKDTSTMGQGFIAWLKKKSDK